jgi:hypothetical protein
MSAIHFNKKRDIGFDPDKTSAGRLCATKHKYERSQNTGARAFTMPLVIGSSSLHGIKGQVVVCTCRSVVFNRVDGAASSSC